MSVHHPPPPLIPWCRLAALVATLWVGAVAHADRTRPEPSPAKVHAQRAERLFRVGHFEAAAGEYEAAYLDSPDADYLFRIGDCYRLAGRSKDADRAYAEFIAEQPSGSERELAQTYLQHGKRRDLATAAPAITTAPEQPPTPTPTPTPPMRAMPLSADLPQRSDQGWAAGGGIYGLVAAAAVFSLGIASEVTRAHQVPSLPLGATATVVLAASAPVAAAGSSSTRRLTGVRGSLGLRIPGWILYGTALQTAVVLIALGALKVTPPEGLIGATTAMGTVSCALLAGDALLVSRQASETSDRGAKTALVTPAVSVLRGGALMGLSGRF